MTRTLDSLPWQTHFVSSLPGDPEARNFTRPVPNASYSQVAPAPVPSPKLLAWSDALANPLGLFKPDNDASLQLLSGNLVLPSMKPYAARYGGHQFGSWAGQLGDGRAITLGELPYPPDLIANLFHIPSSGPHLEFQLKGPGLTPYSRRGDGRAVLRSSLREFLCSEAMFHLGIPTTRALSLLSTGQRVIRDMFYDGNPEPEPGAIVCRVAPSFLRFGNFEIHAAHDELDLLKQLTDYLITTHYPDLDPKDPDVYGLLLDEIARRTAVMIAHWQRVGFVHGVMNTDNMSALGLTIDYGPYGWLDPYDPHWTPNTTDAGTRRYRFSNQPAIAYWNLARLASALHPIIPNEDRLHQSLDVYRDTFESTHAQFLADKLGLPSLSTDAHRQLVEDLFTLLQQVETDHTIFFRQLCDYTPTSPETFLPLITPAFYVDPSDDLRTKWIDWSHRYTTLLLSSPQPDRGAKMKRANPKYIPRNYLAQLAIDAATQGDLAPLERLLKVLEHPYTDQPNTEDFYSRRPDWATNTPGCSALSCSS